MSNFVISESENRTKYGVGFCIKFSGKGYQFVLKNFEDLVSISIQKFNKNKEFFT